MTTISNRWMFIDPEPAVQGILLCDRIEAYVKEYGLLVDAGDFQQCNLKPASYSLTLGPKYYLNGKTIEIQSGGSLEVPPNSFVIAGVKERITLPHWCAARFGLRVAYVYKGLLMGAGPQVDPGFEGNLGCPLHNLTNCSIKIKLEESFAWIDFAKTSRLGQNPALASAEALLDAAMLRQTDRVQKKVWVVPDFKDFECLLYETQRRSFEDSLPPGETVSSSVKGLEDSVESIKTAWERRQKEMTDQIGTLTKVSHRINVASVAGLIALFITVLLTIGVEIWMPRKATLLKMQQEIETLNQAIQEQHTANAPATVPASSVVAVPK
ncbi:MAG: dCTP deaminase domain-containing protein, partial [Nitrososphaerales archaeon]